MHTHIPEVVSLEWGTQSRVGTKGSVTQLPVPAQSQVSIHCHCSCVCACANLRVGTILVALCAIVNSCVRTCSSVCKCAFALCCWPCVHASGRLYVNPVIPPPTNQQTTPGLKMDLLELSALLVLTGWLCCLWFFFFFCNSQNWFGLILKGFQTWAPRFTLKDLHVCCDPPSESDVWSRDSRVKKQWDIH